MATTPVCWNDHKADDTFAGISPERVPVREVTSVGAPPGQHVQWTQLVERQRGEVRRQRTVEHERVERRRRECRTYQVKRAEAHASAGPAPSLPRSASIRKLRADGARQRLELRRRHRTERASLARRLGHAAVRALRRGAAAIRNLFRKHRPSAARSKPSAARSRPSAARSKPTSPTYGVAGPARPTTGSARRRSGPGSRTNTRTTTCNTTNDDDAHHATSAHNGAPTPRMRRGSPPGTRVTAPSSGCSSENAARTVGLDLSRCSSVPYSLSLEQVVAEADRQVARENREPDRHQPRSEAAPAPRTLPAARPARPSPATDAPPTGHRVDQSGNLEPSRPAADIPATGPERSSPPLTFDAHRLADTLAQALPLLSNRTLSSLLRRLDGDHAIDAAVRAALRVLRGRPDDQTRAAAERRHHDRASRAAIAEQQVGRVPLTEGEQRRTFARVVLAALRPLVERTRTLALDGDRDGSRNQRVTLGQAPPGPTPPARAQGAADAQDAARRDIHRGGHNH